MAKDTKKQIKAQMENEYAKRTRETKERYESKIQRLSDLYQNTAKERNDWRDRALKAEQQLEQYKEWNERMQEFCNMSDEDRKIYIANECAIAEASKNISLFSDFYKTIFNV